MKFIKDKLSKREEEVIESVLLGLSNKTIAKKLYISENTVKFHCKNIYQKTGVGSRRELFFSYFTQDALC